MFFENKKSPGYYHVNVEVGMTDVDILQRLQALFGGKIKQTPTSKLGKKDFFRWHVYSHEDVHNVLLRIRPWLGERRRARCDNILNFLSTRKKIKEIQE